MYVDCNPNNTIFISVVEIYFIAKCLNFLVDYDENDYEADITYVCSSCLNIIDDEDYIQALNQIWHTDCFRYVFVLVTVTKI